MGFLVIDQFKRRCDLSLENSFPSGLLLYYSGLFISSIVLRNFRNCGVLMTAKSSEDLRVSRNLILSLLY